MIEPLPAELQHLIAKETDNFDDYKMLCKEELLSLDMNLFWKQSNHLEGQWLDFRGCRRKFFIAKNEYETALKNKGQPLKAELYKKMREFSWAISAFEPFWEIGGFNAFGFYAPESDMPIPKVIDPVFDGRIYNYRYTTGRSCLDSIGSRLTERYIIHAAN